MIARKALVVLIFLNTCSIAFAGIFGPGDFEECSGDAAKEAKTDNALLILLRRCANEFPARRNRNGGYTYYDVVTNQFIAVSSPRLNSEDKQRIQNVQNEYRNRMYIERQKLNADLDNQRNINNNARQKLIVEKWSINCKNTHSCYEKTIIAFIKNNSEFTIYQIKVGWVVSEKIESCGVLGDTETKNIKIPPGQTATVTFDFFDGPSMNPFQACFRVNDVIAR